MIPIEYYLTFAAILFAIGAYGVMAKPNTLIVLMCTELMLNAANINFVAFSAFTGDVYVNLHGMTAEQQDKADHKEYWRYSGWLGGLKKESFKEAMEKHPERVVEHAIKGMLPHTSLGRQQATKLKVYAGPEHPHAAQNPVKIDLEA